MFEYIDNVDIRIYNIKGDLEKAFWNVEGECIVDEDGFIAVYDKDADEVFAYNKAFIGKLEIARA